MRRLIWALTAATMLHGCTNLSGYDAETDFKCKAPQGVRCQSVSGVYANIKAGNESTSSPVSTSTANATTQRLDAVPRLPLPAARNMGAGQPPNYMSAIRSEPTVLRTWVMTYRDSDGDIVDQSYLYLTMDTGQWLVEHNIALMQEAFEPAKPSDPSAKDAARVSVGTVRQTEGPPPATPTQRFKAVQDNTDSGRSHTDEKELPQEQGADEQSGADAANVMKRIQDALKAGRGPAASPANK